MFGAALDHSLIAKIGRSSYNDDIKTDIGFNIMTALSLQLPDNLAKASQKAAQKLGVSRSEFIRQAIVHELEHLKTRLELEAIASSFEAMKKNKHYQQETEEMDKNWNDALPDDTEEWWKKS